MSSPSKLNARRSRGETSSDRALMVPSWRPAKVYTTLPGIIPTAVATTYVLTFTRVSPERRLTRKKGKKGMSRSVSR